VTGNDFLVSEMLQRWRSFARLALLHNLAPGEISWSDDGSASLLFGREIDSHDLPERTFTVARAFMPLARMLACHRAEERWSLLYTLLWRLTHGEPHLLQVASDPLVSQIVQMHRAVKRSAHKMKAFVRFRSVRNEEGEEFIAWFEPAHRVVERTALFFVDRFRSMKWSILTPDICARWNGESLALTEGIEKALAPASDDSLEDYWRTYYAGIFNPARLNRRAMRAEMPKSYWKNLPEAVLIDELARDAPARVAEMIRLSQMNIGPASAVMEAAFDDHVGWDEIHDPGWREARRRAEAVTRKAPEGFVRGATLVVAGVAGWTDPTLLAPGVFYPDDATTPEDRLRFYSAQLPMVEVDSTYYSMPSERTSERWVERTPDHFVFNIKAHSLMTGHPTNPARLPGWLREELPQKLRLAPNVYSHHFTNDTLDEVWRRFLSALEPLRQSGKLGAIMLQYPRWFTPSRASAAELNRASARLGNWPATVEFRHRDWLSARIAPRTFAPAELCHCRRSVRNGKQCAPRRASHQSEPRHVSLSRSQGVNLGGSE